MMKREQKTETFHVHFPCKSFVVIADEGLHSGVGLV